jgi:hypothetical protein
MGVNMVKVVILLTAKMQEKNSKSILYRDRKIKPKVYVSTQKTSIN